MDSRINSVAIVRHFKSNAFGHGGEKRSFQLESLINTVVQSSSIVPQHPDLRPWLQKYRPLNTFKRALSESNFKLPYRQFKTVRHQSKNRLNEIVFKTDLIKDSSVILWESIIPEYHEFPALLNRYAKKRVIACPHNIESLIDQPYYYWKEKGKINRLAKEISCLKMCDEVFTIAEEDQWLLRLFDVNAKYLPYYPEGMLTESLLKVRQSRENRKQDNSRSKQFLILGAAINPPTKKGMESLLDRLSKEKFSENIFQVAGLGTECFSEYASPNIIINGAVSTEDLDQLMLDCTAIIVNQGFSTGSLTKIIEFLVAGIPVICDEGSARSYQRFSGVHCYTTFNMLKAILNDEILEVPFLPQKPSHYYEAFTKALFG